MRRRQAVSSSKNKTEPKSDLSWRSNLSLWVYRIFKFDYHENQFPVFPFKWSAIKMEIVVSVAFGIKSSGEPMANRSPWIDSISTGEIDIDGQVFDFCILFLLYLQGKKKA